ncbi:hypothetical protein FSP39_006859 [Pinctada imbricata]|uniref:Receptor ligand binding region domain-containing protein n=1 Tax=Pinctada imbricata TaxID=66713 RepID=A0AA88XZH1_PINIB|nr:hypothetical protein FSP39_006859 [Pinctada imbricata]
MENLLISSYMYWITFILIVLSQTLAQGIGTTTVHLAVIAPQSPQQRPFSLTKIRPAIDIGVERVKESNILPNVWFNVTYADSGMNAAKTPVEAFRIMNNGLHLFLGPVYDLALAPVGRYAPYWSVPIISPGGLAHDFKYNRDREYSTLTRMGAGFDSLTVFIGSIFRTFQWSNVKLLYDGDGQKNIFPRFCYLLASAYIHYWNKKKNRSTVKHNFSFLKHRSQYEEILREEIGTKYSGEYSNSGIILPIIFFFVLDLPNECTQFRNIFPVSTYGIVHLVYYYLNNFSWE